MFHIAFFMVQIPRNLLDRKRAKYYIIKKSNWAPRIKQWWVTGFNPEFDKPNCNDMVAIGSIDVVGREEMYEGVERCL